MFASDLPLVAWIKWYERASAVFDKEFGYGKADVLLAMIIRGSRADILDYNKWYDHARRIYEARKGNINHGHIRTPHAS